MSDKFLKDLQENLGREIRRSGLSQVELAKKLNITPQALNKLLKGNNVPGVDRLASVAQALGITVSVLLATPEEWERIGDPKGPLASSSEIALLRERLNEVAEALRKNTPPIPAQGPRAQLLELVQGLSEQDAVEALQLLRDYLEAQEQPAEPAQPRKHKTR